MKWFKFIIYFQLFASALVNFVSAVMYFTGYQYRAVDPNIDPGMIYAYYPGLQQADYVIGALSLGIAVFAIIVRMRLASFKQDAPKMYLILLAASIVVTVGYLIAASGIIGGEVLDSSTVGQIVGSGVMIGVNYVYFKNRAHLFVNK